jgi:cobalt-zinc-cadmium efflux system outer membrane protein
MRNFIVLRKASKRTFMAASAAIALMTTTGGAVAQTSPWTLESTVQQVLVVAPERRAAEAEVVALQGTRRQAGLWHNPTVELGASNAMSKEDGQGGTALNEITIRQALPLSGRLDQQRQQADANLKQAQAGAMEQQLTLEYEAARVFHGLQLNRALFQLAEQRLQSADEFQHIGHRREQAGDLSRLERLRLDLVRENASQLIATAEGKESEALSDFQTLLNLTDPEPTLLSLEQLPSRPSLTALEAQLEHHPALEAARQKVAAANKNIDLARANRLADPEIWLSRGRDYLGGQRQDVNASQIDSARATRDKAQFELEALQRQLSNRLRLNHLHLGYLLGQAEAYRPKVLEPAEQLFQLSRSGFSAGEVEILALVDAVNGYYEARIRYLELLQQSWLEAAELRRSAGISLLTANAPISEGSQQ